MRLGLMAVVAMLAGLLSAPAAWAEDGYDLWLRYRPVAGTEAYRPRLGPVQAEVSTPTLRVATDELRRGLGGLIGAPQPGAPPVVLRVDPAAGTGPEGYAIRGGPGGVSVVGASDRGVLYGVFHL